MKHFFGKSDAPSPDQPSEGPRKEIQTDAARENPTPDGAGEPSGDRPPRRTAFRRLSHGMVRGFFGLVRLGLVTAAVIFLFTLIFKQYDPLLRTGTLRAQDLPTDEGALDPAGDLDCVRAESSPFDLFFECDEDGTPPKSDGLLSFAELLDEDPTVFLNPQARRQLFAVLASLLPEEYAPRSIDALSGTIPKRCYLSIPKKRLYLFRIPYVTSRGENRLLSVEFDRSVIYQILTEDPAQASPSGGSFRAAETALSDDLAELRAIFAGEDPADLSDRYAEVTETGGIPGDNLFAPFYLPSDDGRGVFAYRFTAALLRGEARFRVYGSFLCLTLPEGSGNGEFVLLIDPDSCAVCGVSHTGGGVSTLYPTYSVRDSLSEIS